MRKSVARSVSGLAARAKGPPSTALSRFWAWVSFVSWGVCILASLCDGKRCRDGTALRAREGEIARADGS